MVDAAAVEACMGRWQVILGFRDWDLRAEVVRAEWRKSGDIRIDAANEQAVVLVNESIEPEFLEEVVVHELVHLRLHGLDRMMEDLLVSLYGEREDEPRRKFAAGQFLDRLEVTAGALTRALLRLSGTPRTTLGPGQKEEIEQTKGARFGEDRPRPHRQRK